MNPRSLLAIFGIGVATVALMVAYLLKVGHDEALKTAQGHADNLAQTVQGQLLSTLRRAQSDLDDIAARMPAAALDYRSTSKYQTQVEPLLRANLRNFPEMGAYLVWDTQGRLLYGTLQPRPEMPPPSFSQLSYYLGEFDDGQTNLAFAEVFRGRLSGRWTLQAAVPLRDARGRLIAVVTAGIWLDQLSRDLDRLQMPDRSDIFIRRSDAHQLVFRKSFVESEVNQKFQDEIQQRIDVGQSAGRARIDATDGATRLYAFRWLQPYPFYVGVGLDEDVALREWRQSALAVTLILLGMSLALGYVLLRSMHTEKLRVAAQDEAEAARELLQEAIDSLPAGFVIYDTEERMVMCNKAHRQILRSVEDVVERGRTFEEITREALRRGLFVHEGKTAEEWLAMRLERFRQADGRSYELPLNEGRWFLVSEHRTPKGYRVGSRIDITDRKRMEVELRAQASTDALTGLANRRYFLSRLEEELERVRRQTTREAAVLMLDLDHFKRVNDMFGHAAGDSLLRHFSMLLSQELRAADTAGRIGGEEFAVILPGSGQQAALAFAQRICERLTSQPLKFAGQELHVTVSVGVSSLLHEDLSSDAVLSRADRALYRAKEGGRNRVELAHA